jgi:hypothetical protein
LQCIELFPNFFDKIYQFYCLEENFEGTEEAIKEMAIQVEFVAMVADLLGLEEEMDSTTLDFWLHL